MTAPAPEVLGSKPIEQGLAFGRRLYEARMRAGFGSQYALSRRMNLSKLTVHRHESQGVIPHRRTIDEYAWVLGVTPQWLLYGSDDPLLDLPDVVFAYIEKYRADLRPKTIDCLQRVPWQIIAGEDVDLLDSDAVHEIRLLIDRNLRKRDETTRVARPSSDDEPEQLPLLRSLDLTSPGAPRRGRLPRHAREATAR